MHSDRSPTEREASITFSNRNGILAGHGELLLGWATGSCLNIQHSLADELATLVQVRANVEY
jgi:hypothetical protein